MRTFRPGVHEKPPPRLPATHFLDPGRRAGGGIVPKSSKIQMYKKNSFFVISTINSNAMVDFSF